MKKADFKNLCKSYGLKPKRVKVFLPLKVKYSIKRKVLETIYINCTDLFEYTVEDDWITYKDESAIMKLSKDLSEVE